MKTTVRSSVSTPDSSTLREALYTLAIKRLQQAQGFLAHDPSARQDEARTAITEALELIDQAEATRRPKRAPVSTPNTLFLIDSHGRQLKVGDQIGDRDGIDYQIEGIAPEKNTVGVFDITSNGPVKGVRPEAIGCKWQCRGA